MLQQVLPHQRKGDPLVMVKRVPGILCKSTTEGATCTPVVWDFSSPERFPWWGMSSLLITPPGRAGWEQSCEHGDTPLL